MFRRPTASTDTATSTILDERGRRARHSRRTQRREAADTAALRARLDRVDRRLAEVAGVAEAATIPARSQVIDSVVARRDPLTCPFPMAFGTLGAACDEPRRPPRTIARDAVATRTA